MKTYAQALDLKDDPDLIAEYIKRHKAVWPEVLQALQAIGIKQMKIFRTGNRLFMTYEAPDDFVPERDYQSYTENPVCRKWDDAMRAFQQQVPSARQQDWWTPMELVFDLEGC